MIFLHFFIVDSFAEVMPGLNADVQDEGDEYDLSYDNYSFGFHSICDYNHSKKHTDILDILYNKCLRK